MANPCLRPDAPIARGFSVTELPHRAKLDQNEAPLDLPADLKRDLAAELAARSWNRYPQPSEYAAAKASFAAAAGVDPDRLALTVGGDQAIAAAFLAAGGPGRTARWFEPTYPYVADAARLTGTTADAVVLGEEVDERIDAAAIDAAPAPDLVVLVAPNNPTGGMPSRAALAAALADRRRLVLVDEAYADFAGESVLAQVAAHPNLMVARSLSKALLADVRLGWAVGDPEVIAAAERMLVAPYHLSGLQLLVAARIAEILPLVRASAAAVAAERDRVLCALAALPGLRPRPSRANFILFAVAGGRARAAALHRSLAERGVRVRDASSLPGLDAHLRVTIGSPDDNDRFLAAVAAASAS